MQSRTLSRTPDYHTAQIERLYAVRWRSPLRPEWIDRILGEVSAAAKSASPLVYVGISDDNATVPDAALAKRLVAGSVEIARIASELHMVLAGDSMGATLSRSTFRGMLATARVGNAVLGIEHRGLASKFRIHGTIDAFLKHLDVGAPPAEVRAELERLGL
ncbi:MAG: hypothetical protein IT378_21385, partial [Sandaracinaceae bacterium]|nr:hypothetical protein [Sandaracinaceae bacterium]